jgi:hypothetical protein
MGPTLTHDQEEASMRSKRTVYLAAALLVVVGVLLLIGPAGMAPALGDDNVDLQLKVCTCTGTWLSNAEVEAVVYRPGVGQIDSDSGYTDGSGNICLQFDGLQHEDEAHVTVTPQGGSPDPDHRYAWDSNDGEGDTAHWDILPGLQKQCPDDWFDEANNIIRCKVSN